MVATVDPRATADAMEPYVAAGFTTLRHGRPLRLVRASGRGVPRPRGNEGRAELFTKWVPKPGPVRRRTCAPRWSGRSTRMRGEALDLLQFHAWAYGDPAWLDALFHLQELKEEGLIRHLGLTNFDAAHLAMVVRQRHRSGHQPGVATRCWTGVRPGSMAEVCREHGVRLLAYGTVAGGLLTESLARRPRARRSTSSTPGRR